MEKIYQSASKIVFISIGLTTCAGFLIGKMSTEQFLTLAGMAFVYYFTKPKDSTAVVSEEGKHRFEI